MSQLSEELEKQRELTKELKSELGSVKTCAAQLDRCREEYDKYIRPIMKKPLSRTGTVKVTPFKDAADFIALVLIPEENNKDVVHVGVDLSSAGDMTAYGKEISCSPE